MMWTTLLLGLTLAAAPARLTAVEPTADLGDARGGLPLRHRFTIVNPGDVPVTLIAAKASCGCMSPRLSRTELAPGESATLDVEVRTLTQPPGPNQWHVEVGYRPAGDPAGAAEVLKLHLLARLTREVQVEPATLALTVTHPVTHDLLVTDCRPEPLRLVALTAEVPGVTAALVDRQRLPSGHWRNTVRVTVGPDCPAGEHAGDLVLKTADADYPELRVPLRVTRREKRSATVTPDALRLTAAAPSGRLLVRAAEGDVRVEAAECDDPGVRCQWAEGAYPVSSVRVTASGPARAVAVRLRLAGGEVLTVPVTVGGP